VRDPNVPESLEGWWILHRMFAFDRRSWDRLPAKRRRKYAERAGELFAHLAGRPEGDCSLAQLVGHKGDLMLTHYAEDYEGLAYAQTLVDKLEFAEFLLPMSSYVSVLEIGLYDATAKIHAELAARELAPHSPPWMKAFDELLAAQAQGPHVGPRLHAKVPRRRYVCFYPMDKRRGETVNWYDLPFDERLKLMAEHGKVGRSYHGHVTQVISGSIGFDDYEWGVDLYADDPLVFKKLIYEMRFDPASSRYAEFGPFWSGVQFGADQLGAFLDGDTVPALSEA